MSRLISNKVKKTPSSQVSEDRYNFLQLSDAEPDLGIPAGNNYILSSNTFGQRSWLNIDLIRSSLGFKYNFLGFLQSSQPPGDGNLAITSTSILISKKTFDGEDVSDVLPLLTVSTSLQKSLIILKNLEPLDTPQIIVAYATGSQEDTDHYRVFLNFFSGEIFDPNSRISFEFYATGDLGSAVTILGKYDNLGQLQAAHPTGSIGDSYLVDPGDLYVWNAISGSWTNVGPIRGPQGPPGSPPNQIDGGTALTLF
jgi:hypothetical protein